MTPRIVLTQPSHARAWDVTAGRYFLIQDQSSVRGSAKVRKDLGEEFIASILGERETILQVKQSCSMDDAAEKYHNPHSPAFKALKAQMGQGTGQPIYYGPELLLYIHGYGLATFLLAHAAAKNQLAKLKPQSNKDYRFWNVIRFSAANVSTSSIRFYSPVLRLTDLSWHGQKTYEAEQQHFVHASFKSEPYIANDIVRAAEQFKQTVRKTGRKFSREFDRLFNNLVQQANDGDYGIDEFDAMSQSDFH